MKKILILLLSVVCCMTLISCEDEDEQQIVTVTGNSWTVVHNGKADQLYDGKTLVIGDASLTRNGDVLNIVYGKHDFDLELANEDLVIRLQEVENENGRTLEIYSEFIVDGKQATRTASATI